MYIPDLCRQALMAPLAEIRFWFVLERARRFPISRIRCGAGRLPVLPRVIVRISEGAGFCCKQQKRQRGTVRAHGSAAAQASGSRALRRGPLIRVLATDKRIHLNPA